ncbi:MAG: Ig-like domain-containing protein [Comamonas sp.]|nr:Ig-like domain-containing protein [Comamonas sp.]
MALQITPTSTTFIEATSNQGAIANGITLRLEGGVFKGDNGDVLLGAVTGAPAGLTPVLIKTSATTAKLSFTGKAQTHANADDIASGLLQVTLDSSHITPDTPADMPGDGLSVTGFGFDFRGEVAPGTLSLLGLDTSIGNALPALSGTATANATVAIFNGSKLLGTTTAGNDGAWTYTPSGKDGVYQLTAREQVKEKVYGPPTSVVVFTLDTKAPAAPTVNAIKLASSDTTPTISGKAEKGATVQVLIDGKALGATPTVTADAKTGIWTVTLADADALAAGMANKNYAITAVATDAAGNVSAATTKAAQLTIDTTIADPVVSTGLVLGSDPSQLEGKQATQKLAGTAEAGATLQLYGGADGQTALGKPIKVNAQGAWTTTVKLTNGEHLLGLVATDVAGNVSGPTTLGELITVDTVAPLVPTLRLGKASQDAVGKALPTLSGTAEKGSTVEVRWGKVVIGQALADQQGIWVLDSAAEFDGTLPTKNGSKVKLTAMAKDAAGNASKASVAAEFQVNTGVLDQTPPELVAAQTSANGSTVVLSYSQALKAAAMATSAFTVTVNGQAQTVNSATLTNAQVELALAERIPAGAVVTVTYTPPTGANVLADQAGNAAPAFSSQEVSNNVAAMQDAGGGGSPDVDSATLAGLAQAKTVTDADLATLPTTSTPHLNSLATDSKWSGTQVTYSFNETMPSEYSGNAQASTGWQALNAAERTAVDGAMAHASALLGISLQKVAADGDLRLNAVAMTGSTAGFAYFPGVGALAGDIFLDTRSSGKAGYYDQGDYGYMLVLHELAHALGIKHPFEGTPKLTTSLDTRDHTVMSYTAGREWKPVFGYADNVSTFTTAFVSRSSYSVLDTAALQVMYGPNTTTQTGDDAYVIDFDDYAYHTLWDAGGSDTIDASAATGHSHVDLRPGSTNSVDVRTLAQQEADVKAHYASIGQGWLVTSPWVGSVFATNGHRFYTGENNLGIAHGVWIENLNTGAGNDTVYDNGVDNVIRTGAGNDTIHLGAGGYDQIDGGAGSNDKVVINLNSNAVQRGKADDGHYYVLADSFAAQLIGIETLQFNDRSIFI